MARKALLAQQRYEVIVVCHLGDFIRCPHGGDEKEKGAHAKAPRRKESPAGGMVGRPCHSRGPLWHPPLWHGLPTMPLSRPEVPQSPETGHQKACHYFI